jgi:hypothetical protein
MIVSPLLAIKGVHTLRTAGEKMREEQACVQTVDRVMLRKHGKLLFAAGFDGHPEPQLDRGAGTSHVAWKGIVAETF